MRIIIASTFVPFIEGGGRFIVEWLYKILKDHGNQVEMVNIPFWSDPMKMLEQMLAIRLLDLTDWADLLITIRTPSYGIKHPNKVVWFIHHHRGAYDLWGTPYQDIPHTPEGLKLRKAIIQADNLFLREAKRIYTNSKVTSQRLKKFNNIDSEVLYPPLMDSEKYYCDDFRDYIFYPSRITRHKRQYLAIESMKYTRSRVKLVVAGNPDANEELEYVESTIKKHKLEDKVELIGRWISREEKIELFANALGCVYIPYDEDSYGYVTLESYHSKKPVITCTDSGGTLEIVEDGVNGFVASPNPKAIAKVMDKLYEDKNRAIKMGTAGYEKLFSMNITWDNVIRKLVG